MVQDKNITGKKAQKRALIIANYAKHLLGKNLQGVRVKCLKHFPSCSRRRAPQAPLKTLASMTFCNSQ
ncbi:MAG: hypothetical protein UX10_C0012G0056 [Candidatus Magasanikbacteria bacterium GW2011_GWA2_45_39]|uniref:Uncharacterized protein n=1 Tax=Candidatus Magasanikbacteria bacterium GW2011_GWA2_45_39 TaxID=1619041 RepID=A0A0G1MGK2_9BACT|nr:MAG: hypothetical protein UX10_C0012G0056 [Candidatus Magasanikbacteria bacterium GW2011_GWA2_45_39]